MTKNDIDLDLRIKSKNYLTYFYKSRVDEKEKVFYLTDFYF
jgi:hypothetical protein